MASGQAAGALRFLTPAELGALFSWPPTLPLRCGGLGLADLGTVIPVHLTTAAVANVMMCIQASGLWFGTERLHSHQLEQRVQQVLGWRRPFRILERSLVPHARPVRARAATDSVL